MRAVRGTKRGGSCGGSWRLRLAGKVIWIRFVAGLGYSLIDLLAACSKVEVIKLRN